LFYRGGLQDLPPPVPASRHGGSVLVIGASFLVVTFALITLGLGSFTGSARREHYRAQCYYCCHQCR
jgi:hypothetical protein